MISCGVGCLICGFVAGFGCFAGVVALCYLPYVVLLGLLCLGFECALR